MSYDTTISTSTAKMPTAAEMMRLMDDIRRRFPLSELPKAIECPPSTEQDILNACHQMFPVASHLPPNSMMGLPIETNLEVPYRCYAIRFADGSKVMHYLGGFTVRCFPEHPGQAGD